MKSLNQQPYIVLTITTTAKRLDKTKELPKGNRHTLYMIYKIKSPDDVSSVLKCSPVQRNEKVNKNELLCTNLRKFSLFVRLESCEYF